MSLPQTFKGLTPTTVPFGNPELKSLPLQKPGKDQVLIKMAYAGLCHYDIFQAKNIFGLPQHFLPPVVGYEGSGTVVAIGEDLKTPFKVGDRVHVMKKGSLAEYCLTETANVFPIQNNLSFEDAAFHFTTPGVVYLLGFIAKKGGHKIVINTGASSALGRQLVKHFKQLGIKTINVVRKDQYIQELKKDGADYVLNSEAPDFEKKLQELAQKENVTMGADCIGGEMTGKVFKALQPGSVLYCYGNLSHAPEVKGIGLGDLAQKKSLEGLTLNDYDFEFKTNGEWRKVVTEIHSLLPNVFATKVDKVLKLDDINEGMGLTMNGTKVLIKFD